MKRLAVLLLTTLLVCSAMPGSAQENVDIQAVSEHVTAADPERLLMRLNTPIPDELLPDGFSGAKPLAGELLADQRARFSGALDSLTGSVTYTLRYTPNAAVASPSPRQVASPSASPVARGPQTAFASGALTYLLFSEPVDLSDMDALGINIQMALGTDAQAGTVEAITVNDAPALLVSTVTIVNALEFHTEWIAIPVGNVVVVALVTEGSDTFDQTRFRADNEALALSGVAYLQEIIDAMEAA